jgi:hypothetical protein
LSHIGKIIEQVSEYVAIIIITMVNDAGAKEDIGWMRWIGLVKKSQSSLLYSAVVCTFDSRCLTM